MDEKNPMSVMNRHAAGNVASVAMRERLKEGTARWGNNIVEDYLT
ncbi:hypothetical protein ABMA32_09595 [Mesorhizobium sp. VNQ89]